MLCVSRSLVSGLLLALVLGVPTGSVSAGPIFFGPTPYLSTADIPTGFYSGGSPTGLENFEGGTLGFGITASGGGVIGPGFFTDSVDADDGVIDGFGRNGHSFFAPLNVLTFTFPTPVTAAGLVFTDAETGAIVSFEAFGPGMVSLGGLGPYSNLFLGPTTGETAEDRFFGVQDLGGIIALRVTTNIANGSNQGLEIDHLQFGNAAVAAVPEPGSLTLLAIGGLGVVGWIRRRNRVRA